MCGLVAIVERGARPDTAAARRALAAIAHRGPDAEGILGETFAARGGEGAAASVVLGHRRLSIIDVSERSNQPLTIGPDSLVFNGEIYDFREIARELRHAGAMIETTGDSEVLLRLLARDGVSGLARANGMWALCHLDRTRRQLVAVRDRLGKKPLFYTIERDRIVLASEIKAILAVTGKRAVPKDGAIAGYLAEGWLFPRGDGETHLAGIREVRPGHALTIDLDTLGLSEERVSAIDLGPPADPGTVLDIVCDAVERRLVGDRRVCLLLSGGVDSSLILSVLAARRLTDRVVCVTGDAGKSEDAAYAAAALAALGIEPLALPLDYGGQGFDHLLDVCRHQEKPFPMIGNVLGLPVLYAALGERDIRVALDGAGGDEIFAGYWKRQAGFAMRDAARAGDTAWLARVREGGMLPEALAAMRDAELTSQRLPVPAREMLDERALSLLSRDRRSTVEGAPSGDPLDGFGGTLSQALAIDLTRGRMQEWLWQNDRNAMSAGVENRSPLLDFRLAPYLSTGYAAKMDGRWNKRELRALFERLTPLPTAQRAEKQGFRFLSRRFLKANRARVLELLAGSAMCAAWADRGRIVDAISADEDMVASPLAERLVVIAGLEAQGLM